MKNYVFQNIVKYSWFSFTKKIPFEKKVVFFPKFLTFLKIIWFVPKLPRFYVNYLFWRFRVENKKHCMIFQNILHFFLHNILLLEKNMFWKSKHFWKEYNSCWSWVLPQQVGRLIPCMNGSPARSERRQFSCWVCCWVCMEKGETRERSYGTM